MCACVSWNIEILTKIKLRKTDCADDVDPNKTLQRVIDKHEALIRSAGAKFMDPSLDFDNLLPKKSNTEFKHALSGKLERLHKRTRLALVEIARRKQMEDGDLTGVDVNDAQVSSDEEIQ